MIDILWVVSEKWINFNPTINKSLEKKFQQMAE